MGLTLISQVEHEAVASPKGLPGITARGMLMGLAEVVPGVSGGTMAFITGIYAELVASLAKFGVGSIAMLSQPREFFAHHNLRFLLSLGLGMASGILLFAQLMHYLLIAHQSLVWGFFSGVIAMSVLIIGFARDRQTLWRWAPLGLLCGAALLWLPSASGEPALWQIFLGSALAVCAWLLPAVSGSFVLLALGLYNAVIDAIANLDMLTLATVASGCAAGLLFFANLLAWLLRRYYESLLSFLTGFMLGSIAKLWPWQSVSADAQTQFLSPHTYTELLGQPANIGWVIVVFCVGAGLLWLLSKLTDT